MMKVHVKLAALLAASLLFIAVTSLGLSEGDTITFLSTTFLTVTCK